MAGVETFVKGCIIAALSALALALFAAGCATSTVETRRAEKISAYHALGTDEKQLVDQGQIRMGMSSDGVYIAWGPPSEVLESEDAVNGRVSIWRYYGSWMQESRYWAYRETRRGHDDIYLERYLVSDYQPREYVRAEITMKEGRVHSWRTLPKPAQ